MSKELPPSNPATHLREVADRLRIRGEYDSRGSDVADATAVLNNPAREALHG